MKAISPHQPWASLCVTRQPTKCSNAGWYNDCHGTGRYWYDEDTPMAGQTSAGWRNCSCRPTMVKRFETRSWPCPPKLIGSRILIHSTQRKPADAVIGDYRVEPWYDNVQHRDDCECEYEGGICESCARGATSHMTLTLKEQLVSHLPLGVIVGSAVIEACYPIVDRWSAPSLDDVQRFVTAEPNVLMTVDRRRTPVWQTISDQLPYGDYSTSGKQRYAWLLTDAAPTTERCPWCDRGVSPNFSCPVCDGAGRCDPIPARGAQRIWNWNPS